ncbi:unnamed protein product [Closterium sp. Naga37s-1]|nr:unnamed protein product [Closterium sp. Naga37s-1]
MLACAASVALPGWTIGSPAVAQESEQATTSSSSSSSSSNSSSSSSSTSGSSSGGNSSSSTTTTTAAGEDGIFRRYYKPDGTERATNPYSFLIPRGWVPVPVSLNDAKLYGLDSRFVSPTPAAALGGGGGAAAGGAGGYASVVDVFVLPVGNADKASIEEIGDLEDVIGIFGPPDQPSRVVDASIQERPAGTTDLLFPGHSGNFVIRALCPAVFSSSSVVWER